VDDEFLTVAEIAAILKLNQQTVRNWIDQGSLPAFRVGRRVRIRRADFDALVNAGTTGNPPSEPTLTIWDPEFTQEPIPHQR
jgi:excisionase family DNA binding protein